MISEPQPAPGQVQTPAGDPAEAEAPPPRTGLQPRRRRADLVTRLTQRLLGFPLFFLFRLPFLRAAPGFEPYARGPRRLFVCNHVSLLDTILVAIVFWSHGRLPILVLGDAGIWRRDALSRFLSGRVGYLVERGRMSKQRIAELQAFARSIEDFDLLVFPEGTRGDGMTVQRCQPGIYYIAREARAPLVPIFIENMQRLSTKTTGFHPLRGLRQVVVRFGQEITPEEYLALDREELTAMVRRRIQELGPSTGI